MSGESWFWAALLCATGVDQNHQLWPFDCALGQSSNNCWGDNRRLHASLIHEAPQRAFTTPSHELMAHRILRIARLKHLEGIGKGIFFQRRRSNKKTDSLFEFSGKYASSVLRQRHDHTTDIESVNSSLTQWAVGPYLASSRVFNRR